MTTEQELDLVRKGMAPGGGDWEGDPSQSPGNNQEGEPTENDIRRLRANPDLLKDFIEHFGEDAVPNDLQ